MADRNLNGMRSAILATDGLEGVPLVEPRKALDTAGAKTTAINDGSVWRAQGASPSIVLIGPLIRDDAYNKFQAGRSRLPNKTCAARAPR
jgi:hypothetical protein